jgi:hypothetical protein
MREIREIYMIDRERERERERERQRDRGLKKMKKLRFYAKI